MKNWGFAKVKESKIEIGSRLSDMMGLVEGGYVYSTLFEYGGNSPKKYEFLLSMYPQENYRTLCNITMFLDDVPGASAQAGNFLAERNVNILNSVSMEGISNTLIVWKILADVSFVGDMELIKEKFKQLKESNDKSVDKISLLEIRPADIGRVFRNEPNMEKKELRRGTPSTLVDNTFDFSSEYGDLLGNLDGYDVLIIADISSWLLSVSIYKKETKLVRIEMDIPDCPGGVKQALDWIASKNINIIVVFTKLKICYQTMSLEVVCDVGKCNESLDSLKKNMATELDKLNGVYKITKYVESSE